ncbi:MAG: hypothetical protein IPK13_03630 [Deltaproteobacteria bacterium]|nr:hypothetical protein [Deltaproteobacteria bacterium]
MGREQATTQAAINGAMLGSMMNPFNYGGMLPFGYGAMMNPFMFGGGLGLMNPMMGMGFLGSPLLASQIAMFGGMPWSMMPPYFYYI